MIALHSQTKSITQKVSQSQGIKLNSEADDYTGVDTVFNLQTASARQRIQKEFENTNYGVVSSEVLEQVSIGLGLTSRLVAKEIYTNTALRSSVRSEAR